MLKNVSPALAALSFVACAPLTAERALFEPMRSQAPLMEGAWINNAPGCVDAARGGAHLPDECIFLDVRQVGDGRWLVRSIRGGDDPKPDEQLAFRGVLAPAVERSAEREGAPVYLFERIEEGADGSIRYDTVIPVDGVPASEVYVLAEVSCDDVLRDGPVEGVTPEAEIGRVRRACRADSAAAVREAVRRAVIENLGRLERNRFVLVLP